MADIIFTHRLERAAYGRNGPMHALGVSVEQWGGDYVALRPITTHGSTTSAIVPVELDAIPALIKELQSYV